jgi:hypothetical protein
VVRGAVSQSPSLYMVRRIIPNRCTANAVAAGVDGTPFTSTNLWEKPQCAPGHDK